MKKLSKLVLAFLLTAFTLTNCLAYCSFEAHAEDLVATAEVTGPLVLRAGDTVTISLKVDGNSISGMEGFLQYDSTQVTFVSWKQVISSKWNIKYNATSKKFVAYDESGECKISSGTLFSVTFKVNESLAVGTEVSLGFTSVKLSNGKQEKTISAITYKKSIATPLSTNAHLGSLSVGYTLSPAFDPDVTGYSVTVPFEVSALNVQASAEDSKAAVKVNKPYLKANSHTVVTIVVTAENGAQKTYSINVFREQDPNYQPSDVSTLQSLSVSEFFISPAFSSERTNYVLWLPFETTTLTLNATATDSKAQGIEIVGQSDLQVGLNVIYITVTAEDGISKTTYAISAYRAANPDQEEEPPAPPKEPLSNNATVTSIIFETSVDGEKYVNATFGFNPEVYEYNYTIDETVIGLYVAASPEDEGAMIRVLGNMTPKRGETVDIAVLCTAPDDVTVKTYVIHVTRLGSEDDIWVFDILEVGIACAVAMALGASIAAAIIGIAAASKRKKNEIK